MIERIKILTLLQLSNKTKRYSKGSKRIYAFIATRVLIVALLSIVMSLVLYFIKNILYIPTNEYFVIALLILTQGLNIVVAITGLSSELFHSKDNQILFSYPVKSDEVYLSKMIVYYIHEVIRNIYLIIPILVAFGYNNKLSFLYYLNIIPVIFILPLLSVGIASLISIPVSFARNFLKQHPIITFLLVIAFVLGLFYLTYSVVSGIQTPIRIVQLYNRFIISLTMTLYKIASVGTIYTVIGKFLFNIQYFVNLLIIVATLVVVLGLNYLVAKPIYFKSMSSSYENTVRKKQVKKIVETNSLFFTFFNKEFTIARRTPNELINNYALLLTLPFFMYVLNYIYMGINRSTLGNQFVLIFNIMITLIIVTASNTASASAITTEGYEFILIKTAPYNSSKMAWAKITFNVIFTFIVIGLSFFLFSRVLPVFPRKDIWLLFGFVNIVNFGHIISSFQIDLLNPKLSDYATQGSLTHNDNISKSLSNGLGLSLFFGVLALVLFVFMRDIAWVILIALAGVILMYRLIMFQSYLNAYFVDIEY
ncbi:MAG: hypothetical protein WC964_02730 [Acholeplasmataceae bacterium]